MTHILCSKITSPEYIFDYYEFGGISIGGAAV